MAFDTGIRSAHLAEVVPELLEGGRAEHGWGRTVAEDVITGIAEGGWLGDDDEDVTERMRLPISWTPSALKLIIQHFGDPLLTRARMAFWDSRLERSEGAKLPPDFPNLQTILEGKVGGDSFARAMRYALAMSADRRANYDGERHPQDALRDSESETEFLMMRVFRPYIEARRLPKTYGDVLRIADCIGLDGDELGLAWISDRIFSSDLKLLRDDPASRRMELLLRAAQLKLERSLPRLPNGDSYDGAQFTAELLLYVAKAGFDHDIVHNVFADCMAGTGFDMKRVIEEAILIHEARNSEHDPDKLIAVREMMELHDEMERFGDVRRAIALAGARPQSADGFILGTSLPAGTVDAALGNLVACAAIGGLGVYAAGPVFRAFI